MHLIHLITKNQLPLAEDYRTIYNDLCSKYSGLRIIVCFKSKEQSAYQQDTISFQSYTKYSDLLEKTQTLGKNIIISTITESLVPTMHKLKRDMGQAYSTQFPIFTNKAKEREILGNRYPETVPLAILISKENSIQEQLEHIDFPLMVKPVAGVGSRGVMKATTIQEVYNSIENLSSTFDVLLDKGIENKDIIVEEFIAGPQYVINYRVDATGNIFLSLLTHVKTTQDIAIPGYGNRYRIITHDIYDHIDTQKMKTLIEKTVAAGNIRNTYISHNFKITPNGKYKTIEINGRIGGYRLEMNRYAGAYNLYDVVLSPEQYTPPHIQKNIMTMSIRPHTEGIFLGYNEDILEQVKQLPSFHELRMQKKQTNKKVAFATNGGQPLGTLVCLHENQRVLEHDIEKITHIYKKICLIT